MYSDNRNDPPKAIGRIWVNKQTIEIRELTATEVNAVTGGFCGFYIGPTPTPAHVVSGGVLNGKAISKPQPAYPPIA
jgi:hypothetical protein